MLAPAKLNLALHVTGQLTGGPQAGYHLLHSLVAFADVGDEVRAQPASSDSLNVDGPFAASVPPLDQNSLGAALAMVRCWGKDALALGPVAITLSKNLPIASGIGGGSADAAALITLLTDGRQLSRAERADCLKLGADVPMCLAGTSAFIGGIGEVSTPVALPAAALVLVNPGVPVATPDVFRALTTKTNAALSAWTAPESFADLVAYLRTTRNDLRTPATALQPVIGDVLAALATAPFAQMSGSGATCFALLETPAEAQVLASQMQNAHPDWWVRAGRPI